MDKYFSDDSVEKSWKKAFIIGFSFSFIHRLVLGMWMAFVWLIFSQKLSQPLLPQYSFLPNLVTPIKYAILGVWRRWDAIHYYNLAVNGYQSSDPGPTVFSPLTPFLIRIIHLIFPGSIDVSTLIMSSLFFGLALTLLYRFCVTYYQDEQLGLHAIITITLLPLSYFFSAPMSESIYLATVLGMFLASTHDRWWLMGLMGFLAVLSRNQGVALYGVGILLIFERQPKEFPIRKRLQETIIKSFPLLMIVLGYFLFIYFRASKGLPSLLETYHNYSYVFFTDPISSLFINAKYLVDYFPQSLLNVDVWALCISIGLVVWTLWFENHRKLPLLAYNLGYIVIFLSKVNWFFGTRTIFSSGSIARYSLTLFPLTILIADRIRNLERAKYLILYTALTFLLLVFSALHVLFIGPA